MLILILIASLGVILVRDPIHSVILLVVSFIYTAILFYIIGAEFLAVLFMTVYIGAIAVLFLFVVMLLNLRMVELYTSLYYHLPVGMLLGAGIIWLIYYVFTPETGSGFVNGAPYLHDKYMIYLSFTSNISVLGEILYNYHLDIFAIAGIILFIGMVGVIVLTVGLEQDYRPTEHKKSEKISMREVQSNVIWENVNVITKNRQYPWYMREAGESKDLYPAANAQPDIANLKLIPYLHLPKWVKRFMMKHIKEDN